MNRVAITGIGVVSPAGLGAAACFDAVIEGRDLVTPATQTGLYRIDQVVAEFAAFRAEDHFDRRQLAGLDRVSQFAILAAREAAADAAIDIGSLSPRSVCCFLGTGVGGETTRDASSQRVYTGLADRVHPLTVPRIMVSACASQVAMDLGIRGGVTTVSSACASGAHAIGLAAAEIRSGRAEVAFAGGAEACLSYGCLTAWKALHVMSDDRCRPFSTDRRGLILAEGAAVLVLENLAHAEARGATILGELAGFGMSSDAASLTTPDVDGMARAMRWALEDAGWDAGDVDHVNAHGTGTNANDVAEFNALAAVLGGRASDVPVTATKSVLGHALGASPAVELAIAVMSLRSGLIPPIANHIAPDPQCPVAAVLGAPAETRPTHILSNSFAFGGLNAVLAVSAYS